MKNPRTVIAAALAATAVTTALTAAAAGPAGASGPPARASGPVGHALVTLANSVAPFATADRVLGSVPAASKLTVQFWLAPQTAAAERFATAASTPGNPQFRHYVSPAEYTRRFGPTPTAAAAVAGWLKSQGFAGVTASPGRDYVRATAAVQTINTALKIRLKYFKATTGVNAGKFPLRANDRPVSLPASLAKDVIGVTGLDNAAPAMTYVKAGSGAIRPTAPKPPTASTPPKASAPPAPPAAPSKPKAPRAAPPPFACSQWYAQHFATGLPQQFGLTRFPSLICGYTPQQLRKAYGYSSVNQGKGITIALVEVGLTPLMFDTLKIYAQLHGLAAPSLDRYAELSLGRGSACGDPFNTEEQMDVESAYALAPMAKQLVVGGDSCNNGSYGLQALFDADLAILDGAGNRPLAQIASNSWEAGDETIPGNLLTIEHAYLVKAAAEGVTMLFASGDASGVAVPSSDPYATAVGGTTLAMGHDNRVFETGWSTAIAEEGNGRWVPQGEQGAAGGGASLLWKRPAYQQGVVPNSLAVATGDRGGRVRAVPDLSAVGDPFTGMTVGMLSFDDQGNVNGYFEQSIGGTSLAAPLVAGILADAEQGSPAFGLVNPVLYRLARTKPGVYNDAKPLTALSSGNWRGVACPATLCGVVSLATFDEQSWGMDGYTGQVTAPGYDTMTGIGTPNGQLFVNALRHP